MTGEVTGSVGSLEEGQDVDVGLNETWRWMCSTGSTARTKPSTARERE